MATPLKQWINLIHEIVPAPRRRKRKHVVPFAQWTGTFAFAQTVVAKAYDLAVQYIPPTELANVDYLGAVLRVAINKYLLPKLRAYEATHKGIESPEEIGKLIVETIDELLKDEAKLRDVIERAVIALGVPKEEAPKYVELAKKLLPKMREYVTNIIKQLLERIKTAKTRA